MLVIDQLSVLSGAFTLSDISFNLVQGDTLSLMGPSGSGKTSLLEALAGLRQIDVGSIHLHDRDITQLPPRERRIALVPQDNVLFPHLDVRGNLGFAIDPRHHHSAKTRQVVEQLAEQLNIQKLLDRKVHKLSGGEAKRVAIGRALAAQPDLLCLDEAFSGLDNENYEETVSLVQQVIEQRTLTTIHVTHSLQEAQRIGDMIFNLATRSLQKA